MNKGNLFSISIKNNKSENFYVKIYAIYLVMNVTVRKQIHVISCNYNNDGTFLNEIIHECLNSC